MGICLFVGGEEERRISSPCDEQRKEGTVVPVTVNRRSFVSILPGMKGPAAGFGGGGDCLGLVAARQTNGDKYWRVCGFVGSATTAIRRSRSRSFAHKSRTSLFLVISAVFDLW